MITYLPLQTSGAKIGLQTLRRWFIIRMKES